MGSLKSGEKSANTDGHLAREKCCHELVVSKNHLNLNKNSADWPATCAIKTVAEKSKEKYKILLHLCYGYFDLLRSG